MEPEEAIDLLLRTAYPDDASARARNTYRNCAMGIAEQLGYLAIALRHAGSTIRRKIYTIEKYLSLYLARRGYLINPRMSLNDKEADIITTWEIPFRRLENRASSSTSHQDAVALLHLFAFLHHQAIPQTLLQAPRFCKASNVLVPDNVPEILQCMNEDHEVAYARLRHALNILYDYSIIEFDDNTGICSLHPVIHEWARSRIDNSRTITQWLCFAAFLLACSGQLIESGGRTSAIALLPHVDRFVDLAKHFDPSLLYTGDSVFHIEDTSKIYERAGKWRQSLDLLLPIIDTHTKVYGSRHPHTLRVKRKASLCYWNLFEIGHAVQLQNEIRLARWTARPKLLDWLHPLRPMHIDYLISLSDLTQTLWLAGQHRLSQIAGERAMTGLSRDLGRNHLLTLDATFNLGRTYRHLGMLTEAHLLLVFVLQQRKQTLGLDHPDTLMVKNEVAMNLCSRRVFLALSERWAREVHASRSHLLGEEHAYTLWSVNDLVKILSARERPAEAASLLEEAIPAVDRTSGHKHVGMLMTKGNLARAYAQLDRCSDAAHVLEDIIPDMDQRHPDWTYSMIGLIRLYIRLERLDEAEDRCTALLSRLVARDDSPASSLRYLSTALFTNVTRFMLANNSKDSSNAANVRTTASLLAEIYLRRQDEQKLNALRSKYPDMIEGVMDMPFVPT